MLNVHVQHVTGGEPERALKGERELSNMLAVVAMGVSLSEL